MASGLSKDVSGRRVLFGVATKHDPYQTHISTARAYAAEYACYGIEPVALNLSDKDGALHFANALADPNCLGAHCEQGWGLQVEAPYEGEPTSVFEILNKPAVAHVRDMPFYPWLRDGCFSSAPWAHLSFADRASAELMTRVNGPDRQGPVSRYHSHVYFDLSQTAEDAPPWADRPISCLYTGSYRDPATFRQELNESSPEWDAALIEAFEVAKADFYTAIWDHGEPIAKAHGFEADYFNQDYTNFLGTLNQMVRMERRRSLLERIAKYPIHLVWSGDRPEIELHPDTVILEPNTFPETVLLMRQSKAMVMALNSFSAALSERLLTAMRQGAVVLTHPNQLIDETFTHGEDILTFGTDQDSLDAAMSHLTDGASMELLRAKASDRIDDAFHPRHIVRDHLQAMIDFEAARAS